MINKKFTHKYSSRSKAIFALCVLCFLWGTTWIASKEGVKHMPPLQMVGIRQIIAGVMFTVFFMIRGAVWPKGKEWYSLLVLAFLNILINNGLTTWGVKYISAGLGAIISATFPLWMVVIGLFSSKQRMPSKAIQGFLLGFAGICVIFYEHLQDFLNTDFLFGITLSITASWAWAFGTIYTKKNARVFNPYFSLGLQMLISGVIVFSVTEGTGMSIPFTDIPWQSWLSITYLTLIGSGVAFVAYLYALQHLPIEQASIYAYINPIVATILGSILFGEKLTVFIVAGGAIILCGVYMINKALRRPAKKIEELAELHT